MIRREEKDLWDIVYDLSASGSRCLSYFPSLFQQENLTEVKCFCADEYMSESIKLIQ